MNTSQPIGSVCLYLGDVGQISAQSNPAWSTSSAAAPAAPPVPAGSDGNQVHALLEAMGWMVCDGRELLITTYPQLFAVLGILYGGDFGRGLFNLPDLRGTFVRGVDAGAGVDPDLDQRRHPDGSPGYAGVGSLQWDALQAHQHDYSEATGSAVSGNAAMAQNLPPTTQQTSDPVTGRVSAYETRPRNMAAYYIIRFM